MPFTPDADKPNRAFFDNGIECFKHRGTSKYTLLVPLLDLTFLEEFACLRLPKHSAACLDPGHGFAQPGGQRYGNVKSAALGSKARRVCLA